MIMHDSQSLSYTQSNTLKISDEETNDIQETNDIHNALFSKVD